MTDVVFAFGPDGYFFESQTQWRMRDLPERLKARFTSGVSDIAHVYSMALGAGESWFMSYRTKVGGASFAHDGLPDKLAAWLRIKDANGFSVRDIRKLRVSLGPGNVSFWAEDGRDYFWDNLPGPLQLALEKLKSPQGGWTRAPKLVVLGLYQSYVMMSEGGGGSYALSDYYPWLEKELVALIKSGRPGALKAIHHISIDQHDGQNFVMTLVDGKVMYYVPDQLNADMVAIRNSIPLGTVSGAPGGREAETGTNPMPIPHTVSVPAAGPDPYRSPEEIHGQNPLLASSNLNVASNVVHSPASPIGVPAPPYTTSPMSSNTRVNTPIATQVHSGQTPGPSIISNADRVGSPQMYQHPRITALENAAATTRIVSPVPSMSTTQYSYEAAQFNLNSATQGGTLPVSAAEPQPAIVSHSSSNVVSPTPAHHQNQTPVTTSGQASVSPYQTTATSQVHSGQVSAAQGPGSPSPVTLSHGSPIQPGQTTTSTSQIQHSVTPGSHQGHQPSSHGNTPTNLPPNPTGSPLPSAQSPGQPEIIGSPAVISDQIQSTSPPPVPNPTPVPYAVQFAGSPPSSVAGLQISQASVNSPVPVTRSPGSYPAHVDSVPIPAFSTPQPHSAGPQAQRQLVSIPFRPVAKTQPPSQTTVPIQANAASPVGLAEVSGSPPPHRQSVSSSVHMPPPASPGNASGVHQTANRDEITNLPGSIPFMPPTVGSPVAQGSSPTHSATQTAAPASSSFQSTPNPQANYHSSAFPGPHMSSSPVSTHQPQYQTVTIPTQHRPQLVQVDSAPNQQTVSSADLQQTQPQLVRIVSSPGPVPHNSLGGTVQYVNSPGMAQMSGQPQAMQQHQSMISPAAPGQQIRYVQQMHNGQVQYVQQIQATSPAPQVQQAQAAPAAAATTTATTATGNSPAAGASIPTGKTAAQTKKEQQQQAKNKKLAVAFGIGLAKGAVKAMIQN